MIQEQMHPVPEKISIAMKIGFNSIPVTSNWMPLPTIAKNNIGYTNLFTNHQHIYIINKHCHKQVKVCKTLKFNLDINMFLVLGGGGGL
jgi:hypothetical protein